MRSSVSTGQRDRNLLVNLAVTTPRRDTIFFQASRFRVPASGIGTVTIPIELESPTLWNGVENPYLYNVIVKVTDQNVTCDSLAVPAGAAVTSPVEPKTGSRSTDGRCSCTACFITKTVRAWARR